MMDAEQRMYYDDPAVESSGATNIYLNAGRSRKVNSPKEGTVIHLNTDKRAELGVHLNTTFSIASSKKIKLLFLLNFLLSLVCIVVCFGVACYFWHELGLLRRQLDMMKDHLIVNLHQDRVTHSPLIRPPSLEDTQPRERETFTNKLPAEDHDDKSLQDSQKNNASDVKHPVTLTVMQKDLLIAHFHGSHSELKLDQLSIGPWKRDEEVSSASSKDNIELKEDQVNIKEGGLYLVYAQITYITHAPVFYNIWAQHSTIGLRRISVCATGDDSTKRSLGKAQISCSVQTVARLFPGDVVHLSQRDFNKTLVMDKGYSYIGFVKLTF